MTIHGPDPFHTDEASFVLGRTLVNLQRELRDDLTAAQKDDVIERKTLGTVVCLRVLLEAFPDYGFHVHTADVSEWRDAYFAWLDANISRIRLPAGKKKQLRENAVAEFSRLGELSQATTYRLDVD